MHTKEKAYLTIIKSDNTTGVDSPVIKSATAKLTMRTLDDVWRRLYRTITIIVSKLTKIVINP